MMKIFARHILPVALSATLYLLAAGPLAAQQFIPDEAQTSHWAETDSVETVDVPRGLEVWHITPRFADIRATVPDTLPHGFQNTAFTEGPTGSYNTTGNLGAPRISRLFHENNRAFGEQFLFARPYDFFVKGIGDFYFTNTKSPITNLTYHSCGNKQNGEDRITALFAVNAGRRLGMGFRLDYLYGRGYYEDQSTAHFGGSLYASYLGEKYQLHTLYTANHLKNTENGGIEDDSYVLTPEMYPTRYGTADIPTLLTKTWNKLDVNTFYLSHRYNLGFHRLRDASGRIISAYPEGQGRGLSAKLMRSKDSLPTAVNKPDTADAAEIDSAQTTSEFVPVARFIHTLRMDLDKRRFLSNSRQNAENSTYFLDFYLPGDSANDLTRHLHIGNTLAFELCEGFNPWMRAGIRLYARHDLDRFTLPRMDLGRENFTENHISVGAQILKAQGSIFRFRLLGELRTTVSHLTESHWGEFNVEGDGGLYIPLRRDSLRIHVSGYMRSEAPAFYYRHYHSRNAWWDHAALRKEFRTRVQGSLTWRGTRLSVHYETLQNYTHFGELLAAAPGAKGANAWWHGVGVVQAGRNVSLLGVTFGQDFHWGIFHWENELSYQYTSSSEHLPLPTFSGYTNLYLLFRIARVLRTELGADLRYFTSYYAPTYSPIVGSYCTQDASARVKVGNYPVVNAYLNFHLKNTRFYVMASHVNYKSGSGAPFLVPHYPINRLVFRLGLSWNFFN